MSRLGYYLEMLAKVRSFRIVPKAVNYLRYRTARLRPSGAGFTPQIVHLLTTNRCNLQCRYCTVSKSLEYGPNASREDVTLDIVKKAFSRPLLKNALLVDLLGGEPLIVEELEDIVRWLARSGCLTNMSTNGVLLADRIKGMKSAGITRINVSIYPTNYTRLQADLPGINRVFQTHASVVLTRRQLETRPEEFLEITAFAREAGCKSMRFWLYRPMGKNPDLGEVVAEDLPAYREFHRQARDRWPGFILWPAEIAKTRAPVKRCRQLWQHVSIGVRGNIGPCCGIDDSLSDVNLFTSSLDETRDHPFLVQLRGQLLDPAAPVPKPCENCNLLEDPGW